MKFQVYRPVGFGLSPVDVDIDCGSNGCTTTDLLLSCSTAFHVPPTLFCLYKGRQLKGQPILYDISDNPPKLIRPGTSVTFFLQPNFVLLHATEEQLGALQRYLLHEEAQNMLHHCIIYLLQTLFTGMSDYLHVFSLANSFLPPTEKSTSCITTMFSPGRLNGWYKSSRWSLHRKSLKWFHSLSCTDFEVTHEFAKILPATEISEEDCAKGTAERCKNLRWDAHGVMLSKQNIVVPFQTLHRVDARHDSLTITLHFEGAPYRAELDVTSHNDKFQLLTLLCSLTSVFVQRNATCFVDGTAWNPFGSQKTFTLERRDLSSVFTLPSPFSLDFLKENLISDGQMSLTELLSKSQASRQYRLRCIVPVTNPSPEQQLEQHEMRQLFKRRHLWRHEHVILAQVALLNGQFLEDHLVYVRWGHPLMALTQLPMLSLKCCVTMVEQVAHALDYLHRVHCYPHRDVLHGFFVKLKPVGAHMEGEAKLTDRFDGADAKVENIHFRKRDLNASNKKRPHANGRTDTEVLYVNDLAPDSIRQTFELRRLLTQSWSLHQVDVFELACIMSHIADLISPSCGEHEGLDLQHFRDLPSELVQCGDEAPDAASWASHWLKPQGMFPTRTLPPLTHNHSHNCPVDPRMIPHQRLAEELLLQRRLELGVGHYGVVIRAELYSPLMPNERTSVAVKILKTKRGESDDREVSIHSTLRTCPQVVQLMYTTPMCLVMELGVCSLRTHLKSFKRNGTTSPWDDPLKRQLLKIACQLCEGMRVINDEHQITHADVAARNVVLMSTGQVKWTDFGLAFRRDAHHTHAHGPQFLQFWPMYWLPFHDHSESGTSILWDIWSFGVVLWEIFTLGRNVKKEYGNLLHMLNNPQHSTRQLQCEYIDLCKDESRRLPLPESLESDRWRPEERQFVLQRRNIESLCEVSHWGAAFWTIIRTTWRADHNERFHSFQSISDCLEIVVKKLENPTLM